MSSVRYVVAGAPGSSALGWSSFGSDAMVGRYWCSNRLRTLTLLG